MNLLLILWYIFIAFLPGLFWLWFYYKKDLHPEPVKAILKVFFWGMLATIPAIFIELFFEMIINSPMLDQLDLLVNGASGAVKNAVEFVSTNKYYLISAFLIVAPVEEFFKFLVVRLTIFKKDVFNESIDGIIYAIAAGLGFATFENILAAIGLGSEIILLRAVTATLLHAVSAGLMGYFIGKARFNPKKQKILFAQGLIIAILIHGLYNFIITLNSDLSIPFIIVLLAIVYVILALEIRKTRIASIERQRKIVE